jgi:hypothetical protein
VRLVCRELGLLQVWDGRPAGLDRGNKPHVFRFPGTTLVPAALRLWGLRLAVGNGAPMVGALVPLHRECTGALYVGALVPCVWRYTCRVRVLHDRRNPALRADPFETYHYYPNNDNVQALLQASVASTPIEFTATPELLLDSRYDLKRIPFRTGAPVPGQRGVLTLRRRRRPSETEWEWDLDLGLRVGTAWARQTIFALLIAGGLAVTPIVAAYQNSALSNHAQHVITVVSILSGLAVGIAASFGLRRSI